jgi:hypothetical protein
MIAAAFERMELLKTSLGLHREALMVPILTMFMLIIDPSVRTLSTHKTSRSYLESSFLIASTAASGVLAKRYA